MRNELKNWVATALAGSLVACGGSSDDAPSAKPQLFATAGDATVYRGIWRSDCGSVLVGTTLQGAKIEFDVTSAAGNVANGNLTTRSYFSPTSCTDGAAPLSTSMVAVTLTIDAAAVSVDGDYTGQADKVTLSSPGSGPTTSYFGFVSAKDQFYISSSPSFSTSRLMYTKSVP